MTGAAIVLVFVLAGAIGFLLGRSTATGGVDAATVEAVRRKDLELRELVARLKDIAWDNRELDPALSTIIIDEIRTYEKKELGP